jgi:hypothetical protein
MTQGQSRLQSKLKEFRSFQYRRMLLEGFLWKAINGTRGQQAAEAFSQKGECLVLATAPKSRAESIAIMAVGF